MERHHTYQHTALWTMAVWIWTASVAIGTVGVVDDLVRLMYGSVMLALVGCLVSSYISMQAVVRKERVRLETLVDAMVLRAQERARDPDVRRIH